MSSYDHVYLHSIKLAYEGNVTVTSVKLSKEVAAGASDFDANYYFYGDDFLVRKISCVPPTASLVSDITSNSATINITSNDSRWLVAVSSSPLDPSRYVYGDVYNDTISNPAAIIPNLNKYFLINYKG